MTIFMKAGLLLVAVWGYLCAQQTTDYLIVDIPIGTQSSDKVLWVKWAGISRGIQYPAPDSGTIYFDRTPGGGDLSNYRYKVTKFYTDTSIETQDSIRNNIYFPPTSTDKIPKRGSAFKAIDQPSMGFGVFYCVVALPFENDTFVSNEFQLMIESPLPVDWIGPTGTIGSVTPTFQWNTNTGVPYYHIILSDDIIKIDTSTGTINLQGLSIIWQAITPSTQIVYGAPDPSNTITADPPPLSPGQKYTWVVLNNYGNHAAFSSTKIKLPPGEFSIEGTTIKKPVCIYPSNVTLTSTENKKVTFKWKNLDKNANTYKLYIYVGTDFQGINAQMIVYQTEVVASGRDGTDEVDSVEIDAVSVLTSNKYVWRMIAVDDQGAGTVGDTVGFRYWAPVGTMRIYTKEQIVIGTSGALDTVTNPIGLVQIKVDVLDGSLEAPLLFYTDQDGYLTRERPTGAYRLTAIKSEFEMQSKTVVVEDGKTITDTFFLERPDATVYGKVVDSDKKGINLALVYGISDRGDTVTANTDALGSFILNCYAADWRIGVKMNGYVSTLTKKITVEADENYNFGTVTLIKNPYTLSGTVKNSAGKALLGARVRIYKDGTLISEIPSTPETGAFSFTVTAGSYTLLAEKTGFTSYNKSVDVMSSKAITVTLEPGATLVTGYVYGKTWVGGREVIAPITGANVVFVKDGTTDTVKTVSNATYGDYKASLSGEKKYFMSSSADGFVALNGSKALVTIPKSTQTMHDTLQSLGMISGTVLQSSSGMVIGGVTVNFIGVDDGVIAASGITTANGTFEMRNIPDGIYKFNAAKEGLELDSIGGRDSVVVSEGKPDTASKKIYLKPANKIIKWWVEGIDNIKSTVKIQSPLVRKIASNDSLKEAGAGAYIITVDAAPDSIIDIAYHTFTVPDTVTEYIDTVTLDIIHHIEDTLVPDENKISISVMAGSEIDSIRLYYKDAVATAYRSLTDTKTESSYTFTFTPPQDGSTMLYYFRAYRGRNVFGYDKEVYSVYIAPDTQMISRFEILPSTDEVLSFPSNYEVPFTVKGYVSSSFIATSSIDEQAVTWELIDAQGCTISKEKGITTTLTTVKNKTSGTNVRLKVTLDTSKIMIAPGLSNSSEVAFSVTGTSVKSLSVIRTDAQNPSPITTSSTDVAEFSAIGTDDDGNNVTIAPVWSIQPTHAGTITTGGVFKPARNFVGTVQIIATTGKISGNYRISESTAPGLNVRFMIVQKTSRDTASSGTGCMVIFPSNVVSKGDIGLLEITRSTLSNQFKRASGLLRTADTAAFDIRQIENVTLNLSDDSLRLNLSIPEKMRKDAISGKRKIHIAQWIEDSVLWKKIDGAVITDDGSAISVGLTHFSRYSIVYEPSETIAMDIAPNPFSPFIIPHYNPFNPDDRVVQHPGVCIRVLADIEEARTDMNLRIYTLLGDRVWSFVLQNADNLPYYIWWDGRTTHRDMQPDGAEHVIIKKGNSLCRNGRYFAVLTAKVKGKEERIMKQIVLMK